MGDTTMKKSFIATAASAAAALALAWAPAARADGPVIIQNPPPQAAPPPTVIATERVPREHYIGPNRAMLTSGIVVLGLSYGISLGVAAESDHFGDSHLYVPIAGPWMDIADRGRCGSATTSACGDNETANKVGLAIDGVFQAIGAFSIVGAFLWPEEATTTVVAAKTEPPKPQVHITPTAGRNGTGLAVIGTF
jgi:hypothetical protein